MTKYTDEEYKLIRDIVADMSNACDGFIFDREANICLLLDPEVAKDVINDSARTLCALVERSAKKTGGWHQNSEKKMPLHLSIKKRRIFPPETEKTSENVGEQNESDR